MQTANDNQPDTAAFLTQVAQLMEEFEQAARAHEMKGSRPPEEHDAIQQDYLRAQKQLYFFIAGLYGQRKTYMDICDQLSTNTHALCTKLVPLFEMVIEKIGDDNDPRVTEMHEVIAEIKTLAN